MTSSSQISPPAPTPLETGTVIAMFKQSRFSEAAASAEQLANRYPNHAFGWKAWGAMLDKLGRSAEALLPMQKAAALNPGDAELHTNIGKVFKDLARFDEAEKSHLEALRLNPRLAIAHNNLGNLYATQRRHDDAIAAYRRAIEIDAGYAGAYVNLGSELQLQGNTAEAEARYRDAIRLAPDFVEALYELGVLLQLHGRLAEAEVRYLAVLTLDPAHVEACNNLANILKDLGRLVEARDLYRRAIQERPDFHQAHANLSVVLQELGELADAEAACRRSMLLKSDFPLAHISLATILGRQGRTVEAVDALQRALQLSPNSPEVLSKLLFYRNYSSNSYQLAREDALEYGRLLSARAGNQRFTTWSCSARPPRLRVGLVSGDMRGHVVGHFLEAVLANLDMRRIELFGYPSHPVEDTLTQRLKPHFSAWKPLTGLGDPQAAELIHSDGLNILLDLSGHTAYNRLPLFAWKPAPVQASWLGYFATTGVAEMDYFIADPWSLPEGKEVDFTESIWRLPETRLCMTVPPLKVDVSKLPALQTGYVTFGCFNNLGKINEEVMKLWARILKAIPGSRLFLKADQLDVPSIKSATVQRFAQLGIDPERLMLEGSEAWQEYFTAYQRVDIGLDPFPYAGGTTTIDSLWMGVPVLTIAGERLVSRQGVSLLTNAGLHDWIATDIDDYLRLAIAHSADLARLAALRKNLRAQVLASPIFDAPRFARHFEDALFGMWKSHARG